VIDEEEDGEDGDDEDGDYYGEIHIKYGWIIICVVYKNA
jgi:hypothetical protein